MAESVVSISQSQVQTTITGDKDKIKAGKKGSKHVQHCRRADYPEMETELYKEYKEERFVCIFTNATPLIWTFRSQS